MPGLLLFVKNNTDVAFRICHWSLNILNIRTWCVYIYIIHTYIRMYILLYIHYFAENTSLMVL